MATHVEMEMNSCLTEMERLQAKMMDLQETKNKQEAEQEEKTIEAEPNMAVMKMWLDKYNFNQEQKKMSEVSKKNYDDYLVRLRGRNTRQNPLSTKEEEERVKIMGDHRKYCNRNFHNDGIIVDPNNLKFIETFQPIITSRRHNIITEPSDFMKQYIEATHNLFQIQQKRIDELETVVAELSAKNQ